MNALDHEMPDSLKDAVCNCEIRAIFITGPGTRSFCADDDVKSALSNGAPFEPERAVKAKAAGGVTRLLKPFSIRLLREAKTRLHRTLRSR